MTANVTPPTLPRLSSFLRAPSVSSSSSLSPLPPAQSAATTTTMPSSTSPLMMRPMRRGSLTQTFYDQTQHQFSQSLHIRPALAAASSVLLRTNSSSSLQEDIHHSQQQRSRKRKSISQDHLLQQHGNNSSSSAFPFPARLTHSSQAPDSREFTRSASFSSLYDRTQMRSQQDESRDNTRSQSFSWKQQTSSPVSSSTQHEQATTDNNPVQQRERTSRYLSEGDRRTIISRIEHGEKQVTLAKEYCVSRAAICNLYKNRKEVLTRVDRDPEAKHPKKQRPKKSPAAASLASGIESPQSTKSAAVHAVSPFSSPADDEDDEDLSEQLEEEKVKPETERPQRLQQIPLSRATTTLVRMQRTLTTKDLSGPMETIELPSSSSSSSLTSRASSSAASTTARRGGTLSPASTLELHRQIKPFLVHEALVYSLPIKKLLCSLRNVETHSAAFRHQADRVMRLLIEEALGCLPQVETDIVTPYGDSIPGIIPTDEREICAISMEGQQEQVLLRAFADVQPLSSTGVLSLSPVGDSSDWQIHAQLPPVSHGQVVLLLDLFCGTGERACSALSYLVREARINPSHIYFITVNAALPGLQRVHHYFPDVSLVTAQMDKVVDTQGRIRPGVGDFLERYWNRSYRQEQSLTALHVQAHARRQQSHHYHSQR